MIGPEVQGLNRRREVENRRLREAVKEASGRLVLAGVITSLLTFFVTRAGAQTVSTDLLAKLSLSGYPSSMRPPDFTARTVEGQTVSLAGLRGKVVLLNFWATWCQECRPEMPLFERLHREFTVQGLSVIGINAREGTDRKSTRLNSSHSQISYAVFC